MADRAFANGKTNLAGERTIRFKFFVDAGNAPTLPAALTGESGSPLNNYISGVTRVSQGLFRIALSDPYLHHVVTTAQLNVNAAGQQRFAQPGPVANFGKGQASLPTVDILVVDNAGAVQDPAAANANNFISGTLILGEVAND